MEYPSVESLRNVLKNKTNGYEYVRKLTESIELNKEFNDPILTLLMNQHPDQEKVKDLLYCVFRIHPTYRQRTLYIKTKNKDEDTVSWKTCVESILGKYDAVKSHVAAVKSAFRLATFDDFHKKFFLENTTEDSATCAHCKKYCYAKHLGKTPTIHIDHYLTSFQTIIESFLSHKSLSLSAISVKYVGLESHIDNEALKKDWIEWHNRLVTYRILCSDCNTSFGSNSR